MGARNQRRLWPCAALCPRHAEGLSPAGPRRRGGSCQPGCRAQPACPPSLDLDLSSGSCFSRAFPPSPPRPTLPGASPHPLPCRPAGTHRAGSRVQTRGRPAQPSAETPLEDLGGPGSPPTPLRWRPRGAAAPRLGRQRQAPAAPHLRAPGVRVRLQRGGRQAAQQQLVHLRGLQRHQLQQAWGSRGQQGPPAPSFTFLRAARRRGCWRDGPRRGLRDCRPGLRRATVLQPGPGRVWRVPQLSPSPAAHRPPPARAAAPPCAHRRPHAGRPRTGREASGPSRHDSVPGLPWRPGCHGVLPRMRAAARSRGRGPHLAALRGPGLPCARCTRGAGGRRQKLPVCGSRNPGEKIP